jgi:hypothetical protein
MPRQARAGEVVRVATRRHQDAITARVFRLSMVSELRPGATVEEAVDIVGYFGYTGSFTLVDDNG